MENITKVLESLGNKASLRAAKNSTRRAFMESAGLSKTLVQALMLKSSKQIERLTDISETHCCFIMVPPETSNVMDNTVTSNCFVDIRKSTKKIA